MKVGVKTREVQENLRVGLCTPSGSRYLVELKPSDNVGHLKAKIRLKSGIGPEWQALYINGYYVDDDKVMISDLFELTLGSPRPAVLKLWLVFPLISWAGVKKKKDLDINREAFIVSNDPKRGVVTDIIRRNIKTPIKINAETFALVYPSKRYKSCCPREYVAQCFSSKEGDFEMNIVEDETQQGCDKRLYLQGLEMGGLTERKPDSVIKHREKVGHSSVAVQGLDFVERLKHYNQFLLKAVSFMEEADKNETQVIRAEMNGRLTLRIGLVSEILTEVKEITMDFPNFPMWRNLKSEPLGLEFLDRWVHSLFLNLSIISIKGVANRVDAFIHKIQLKVPVTEAHKTEDC